MVPLLFPGVPGSTELFVLLLTLVPLLLVPGGIAVGVYLLGKRRGRAEAADDASRDT
jgi:hypothetical protein